jgi:hypothetical protein
MSDQPSAEPRIHDLRERKVYVFEELRKRSIKALTEPTTVETHEFDADSDSIDFAEETKAAELVADLQQKLVINSPVADDKVINQAVADEHPGIDNHAQEEVNKSVQADGQNIPSAPRQDEIFDENDRTDDSPVRSTESASVSSEEQHQAVSLRPLYPDLTKITTKPLANSSFIDPSSDKPATSGDELNTTKYKEILTPVSTVKKTLKFDAVPTYEQAEKFKMEECRMAFSSVQVPGPAYHIPIADAIIAPKIFSGTAVESGEEWLEYLDKYFEFRHIRDEDKVRLFGMLLRGAASDWMSTLTHQQLQSYDALKDAFKETYYPSQELRYREASALWRDVQGPHEKFDDFLTRLRRGARRCQISDDLLHLAVLNGLRPNLRCQILSSGIKDFPETIRLARAAEATLSTDPVTALLLENMKNTSQMADKHSQEIKELSTKVTELSANAAIGQSAQKSEASSVAATTENSYSGQVNRAFNPRSTDSRNDRGRGAQRPRGPPMGAPQPRNWRNAGARQQARSAAQQSQNVCTKCGLDHNRGYCPADEQTCRKCQRVGHYARCCRSGQLRRD